jgi:hypothetical protein
MSEKQELKDQIHALQCMIEELPGIVAKPLLEQLSSVVKAIMVRDMVVRNHIVEELDDVRLKVKMMEFDLESTKAEKQALQDKLEGDG